MLYPWTWLGLKSELFLWNTTFVIVVAFMLLTRKNLKFEKEVRYAHILDCKKDIILDIYRLPCSFDRL